MKMADFIEHLKTLNQEQEVAWAIWTREQVVSIANDRDEKITVEEQDSVLAQADELFDDEAGLRWADLEDIYDDFVKQGKIKPQQI